MGVLTVAREIFTAAFQSAAAAYPHDWHTNSAWLFRLAGSQSPLTEQVRLVSRGSPRWRQTPASAALQARTARSSAKDQEAWRWRCDFLTVLSVRDRMCLKSSSAMPLWLALPLATSRLEMTGLVSR